MSTVELQLKNHWNPQKNWSREKWHENIRPTMTNRRQNCQHYFMLEKRRNCTPRHFTDLQPQKDYIFYGNPKMIRNCHHTAKYTRFMFENLNSSWVILQMPNRVTSCFLIHQILPEQQFISLIVINVDDIRQPFDIRRYSWIVIHSSWWSCLNEDSMQ